MKKIINSLAFSLFLFLPNKINAEVTSLNISFLYDNNFSYVTINDKK